MTNKVNYNNINKITNVNNKRIREFTTDNGREYINKNFQNLFNKAGIKYNINVAYSSE